MNNKGADQNVQIQRLSAPLLSMTFESKVKVTYTKIVLRLVTNFPTSPSFLTKGVHEYGSLAHC